jgi:hypothetical protein
MRRCPFPCLVHEHPDIAHAADEYRQVFVIFFKGTQERDRLVIRREALPVSANRLYLPEVFREKGHKFLGASSHVLVSPSAKSRSKWGK